MLSERGRFGPANLLYWIQNPRHQPRVTMERVVKRMDAEKLSHRLATVAEFVPQGARVADIGTDHAYLPAALMLAGKISFAVAGDVTRGPLENAKEEIARVNLTGKIQPRLADGLAAITAADRIDTVVIAGMGGALIAKILEQGKEHLAGVQRLILQPNIGAERVREWLMNNHYELVAERILAEDGHVYEILVVTATLLPVRYNQRELRFGPPSLEEKNAAFREKWAGELTRLQAVLDQLAAAPQPPAGKVAAFAAEIAEIKGVLQ